MNEIHPLDIPNVRPQIAAGGFSYQTIAQWRVRGTPIQHCPVIEKLTQGVVTRKMLRPDDWQLIWPELVEPKPTVTDEAETGVAQ